MIQSMRAVPKRKPLDLAYEFKRVRRELRRLKQAVGSNQLASIALKKFQTTGELAAPMTRDEVAAVLGRTNMAIATVTSRGQLKMRWPAKTMYHPDDVRAFLNHKPERATVAPSRERKAVPA